jgi:glycosyltransferase involved in cell wall biosynthesis
LQIKRPLILFVTSGLAAGGGAEQQWSALVPAVRDAGFGVFVLTLVAEGALFDRLRELGVPAACMRMRHRSDVVRLRRALRYTALRPDLVATQSINADVVGYRIATKVGAAHVLTDHAGPIPVAPHRTMLMRAIAPRVDAVVAVSHSQIPKLLRLGFRSDRLHVIPNGVPESSPRRSAESVRAELDVPADAFVAILVASLRPEKSVDVFIRAIQEANEQDTRVRGLVAGGGPEAARLQALAAERANAVRLIGHRADVPDLLHAADAGCLSSSAEASPLGLLETMAAAKPVVATDVGGVSEIVEHEKTGLLVPPADPHTFASAVGRLAADRTLADRLGRAGRERQLALFSTERMIASYLQVFEEVLVRRRS